MIPDLKYDLALLNWLKNVAIEAGQAIMEIYDAGDTNVRHKEDRSPVTDADEAAERIILDAIRARTPDIPAISEEEMAAGISPAILRDGLFWLVDPLDGTKEFLARNGEFTVNIGLVAAGVPHVGLLHAPALDTSYGGIPGIGAYMWRGDGNAAPMRVRNRPRHGAIILSSRSHTKTDALQNFMQAEVDPQTRISGSALKFGLIAEGQADLYPRFGPTMEWDTAAGHAILLAAGGQVTQMDGSALTYGKPGFLNPPFLATGAPA